MTLQQEVIRILREALKERAGEIGQIYSFIEEQGSTGRKQTQLRNKADIDLFIGLSPDEHGKIIRNREAIDKLLNHYAKD